MAVYKVIQDIEAEDKLLGPLTLKGFVYAIIAGVLAFLSIRLAIAGSLGDVRWAIIVVLLPPIILFTVLAFPFGREQPTEVWILSYVRFFLKPKKRIWDQSGASQTVVITVPKKIEKNLTKGLSQMEVKSRLKALAATLDSRGWAVKNVDVNLTAPLGYASVNDDSQRLIGPSAFTQPSPVLDIHAKDDILDADNNTTAQYFNQLMQKADTDRRQAMLDKFNTVRQEGQAIQSGTSDLQMADTSSISPPADAQTPVAVAPDVQKNVRSEPATQPQPAMQNSAKPAQAKTTPAQTAVTTAYTADKMELAKSGNAFSVASLSRLANRHEPTIEQVSPNEVVINLH